MHMILEHPFLYKTIKKCCLGNWEKYDGTISIANYEEKMLLYDKYGILEHSSHYVVEGLRNKYYKK